MTKNKKSKNVEASDSSSRTVKSTTKTKKATKAKKVVPSVDALKVDCPVENCHSKKGHRCIRTHAHKGEKRNPHRARTQRALRKLAPAKKAA